MTQVLDGALGRREKLLVALKQLQPVRAQDLADWIGVPEASASAVLKELAKVGAATRDGDLWSARLPVPAAPAPIRPAPLESSDEGPRRRIVRPVEPTREPAPEVQVEPTPGPPAAPEPRRSRTREVLEVNRNLLGTESDPKLAAQLGVPREALTQYRLEAGIRSWREQGGMLRANPEKAPAPSPRPQPQAAPTPDAAPRNERGEARRKLLAVRDRLGNVPDQVVAAELGVSRAAVVKMRDNLGIPAWQPKVTSPLMQDPVPEAPAITVAPATAEPVAQLVTRAEAGFLWAARVRDGEEVRTVQIAAVSLFAAATAAMEALEGRVEAITLVGPVLLAR